WLAPKANPIGVDFGSDALRMAQVAVTNGEHRLIAAASCDVPSHVRHSGTARLAWFSEAARDLLSQGGFRGRQAVLSLPAASMFIQHLRMPRADEETIRKTLSFEARGKLPVDPSHCLMRHVVAGDVFCDQEPRSEVIVMAAPRELVNQFLDAAGRARLDVTGLNVEPVALIDCFSHLYRRKTDREAVTCYVDIGAVATRAVIARGREILFARIIPIGGDHFTRAVATAAGVGFEQAKLLRIQGSAAMGREERREAHGVEPPGPEQSFALLSAAVGASSPPSSGERSLLEQACLEPLSRLIEELNLCRRYHEATFPNRPVEKLIFVGGEARQRWMCQQIARQMQLAAQIGDPLMRMARVSEVGIESGIDRRQPQPAWVVALGLSMGPAAVATEPGERRERRGAA
ncbi:MAG: pilus assembly protein PilM, partial [Phycisphaerae bacterium]|nr:pilus assembly protein PilM [Phycisphaerae bacterium]